MPFARKEDDTGFRDALEEILVEELSFTRNRDYIISSVPRLHFQSPLEFPDRCEPVWVVVQFFLVELFGNRARQRIEDEGSCRWVSEAEILREEENDLQFDPQMSHLIRHTGIFN